MKKLYLCVVKGVKQYLTRKTEAGEHELILANNRTDLFKFLDEHMPKLDEFRVRKIDRSELDELCGELKCGFFIVGD